MNPPTHSPSPGRRPAPRLAFVIGSGGVRSAAALGAAGALAAQGIRPDLIVGCSSGKVLDPEASDYWEEYLCTNRSETARLDLPPRFVSLMEGCGFSWGGHWGDPAGDAEAEGRHLGCDPMHFELPE